MTKQAGTLGVSPCTTIFFSKDTAFNAARVQARRSTLLSLFAEIQVGLVYQHSTLMTAALLGCSTTLKLPLNADMDCSCHSAAGILAVEQRLTYKIEDPYPLRRPTHPRRIFRTKRIYEFAQKYGIPQLRKFVDEKFIES